MSEDCSRQLPGRWSEVVEQIERVNEDNEQQRVGLLGFGPAAHSQYGPSSYLFQLFSCVYPHH